MKFDLDIFIYEIKKSSGKIISYTMLFISIKVAFLVIFILSVLILVKHLWLLCEW